MAEQGDMAGQTTLNDIEVGIRLYEALGQHVQRRGATPIGYADLLTVARQMYPRDAALGRAVPLGVAMKLRLIAAFCAAKGYPDLASLALPALDAEAPGIPDEAGRAVAAIDWPGLLDALLGYADEVRAAVPKRLKPRKERPADVAWYAYFCSHREACAQLSGEDKTEIINLLMAGLDPETAMRRVLRAKTALGSGI